MQLPVHLIDYSYISHYGLILSSLKSAQLYSTPADVVLDNMLAICDCKLLVADDDETIIYGVVCYSSTILLWIYIKEAFRGHGLSNYLLPDEAKIYWLKGTNKTWHKWTKHKKLVANPLSILMK
jgi:hypothetical protein